MSEYTRFIEFTESNCGHLLINIDHIIAIWPEHEKIDTGKTSIVWSRTDHRSNNTRSYAIVDMTVKELCDHLRCFACVDIKRIVTGADKIKKTNKKTTLADPMLKITELATENKQYADHQYR